MSTTILYNSCNKQLLHLKKLVLTANNTEEFKAKLFNLKNNVKELVSLGKTEVLLEKRLALKDKVAMLEADMAELERLFVPSQENNPSLPIKEIKETSELVLDFHNIQGQSLLESESRVEEFIALGTNALTSLREERDILKSSKRRLLDSLHFLGLSNSVIRKVEARFRQDYYILYGGIVFCLVLFYFIVKYL